MLTNKFKLLNSLCWSSVLLVMPTAIAQEVKTPATLPDVTKLSAVKDPAIENVKETENNSVAPNLKSNHFTTSAADLAPVELNPPTSTLSDAAFTDVVQATSPSLELAQVRPAANGVSGPPVPAFPASTTPASTGTPAESPTTTEPQATAPVNKWHFLFQPYVIAPLSIYGHATVRGYRADFNAGPSSIYSKFFDTFQFGALGRLEGWTPNYRLGFLLNGEYLSFRGQNNFTRPNPNRLLDIAINRVADRIQARVDDTLRQQIADYLAGRLDGTIRNQIEARLGAKLETIIPSSFKSDTRIQTWNVDLAGAYRFYNQSQVNPKGVATEFDLGPYLIDIIGGVRIAGVSSDLNVTTNLGGEFDVSRSITTVKPVLGTRFRYNFSPYLAGVIAGSVAGFSIGSLGLNWEAAGGLDWMFSGNTSVGLGYRFAYTGYKSDNVDVSAYNNGPYLTFTFRF